MMHLPVANTLRILLFNLRTHLKRLIRSLALPAGLASMLDLYIWNSSPPQNFEQMYEWVILLNLAVLLAIVLWALLAVSCHRVLLEDADAPTVLDGVRIGGRQLKYIMKAAVVALPLIFYYASIPVAYEIWSEWSGSDDFPNLVRIATQWAVLIPSQYLSSRVALTLPAAALQKPLTFSGAWSLSRGNGWRITAVLLAVPAASEVLGLIVDPVLSETPMLSDVFWFIVSVISGVMVIGALSYSYKWFMHEHGLTGYETAASF